FNLNSRDELKSFQITQKNFEQLRQRLRFKRAAVISKIFDDNFRTPNVYLFYSHDNDPSFSHPIDPWVIQIDNGIKYTFDVTRTMFCKGSLVD
ncbi:S-adenosylmethionine-dependent methyltransferase-like protein, partial [Euroglyphus maynei]